MLRVIKFMVLLVYLVLAACQPAAKTLPTASAVPSKTPWPTRTHTATEVPPTETLTPTITPVYATPTPTYIFTALDTSTWLEYANPNYNFAFYYPPDWKLTLDEEEDSPTYQHLIRLRPQQKYPIVEVLIGFRALDEDINITRPAVGSGELVVNGEIRVLGAMVSRQLLVWDGKHRSVFYNGAAELRRHELVLTLSLDYVGKDTVLADLTLEQEQIADQIMASIRWIEEPTQTPTITPTVTSTAPFTATPTPHPSITVTVTPTLDPSITVTITPTPTVTNTTSAYP